MTNNSRLFTVYAVTITLAIVVTCIALLVHKHSMEATAGHPITWMQALATS